MTEVVPESAAAVAARRVEVEWRPERGERNLSRVHARRARQRVRSRLAIAGALVAAAAALLLFVLAPRSSTMAPATVARNAAPALAPSPKMTFADGSVARVSDGGELVVKLASAERIESLLAAGAADFEVTKHAERDFVVVAGPVRVRVVGTRFRVERAGERTRVSVTEGKVEVQEGEVRVYLEAGESRFFPSAEPIAKEAVPQQSSGRARFLELARSGEFKAAYLLMSQTPGAVGSSAEDLLLAADAARLSGHPEQALGYLRRVTTEHASDSRAPLSAFTLGRVLLSQLSRPGEAAEAFALARRLKPGGGLAEDALAREAEARAAAGSRERAQGLARDYLARYPQGKHRPTMQKLLPP
ncbi:MAG TPA: FecR family protein [Polyangiaceae bacterium]|nr:FecR family protein [Polyangiaceae bacterium]